ncbi:MAG: hypothetical protein KIT84_21285 [Labilithrix sp.]|nr:hypothetical protein [Labilithrix sp.]MCW5813577.1 hypothetical protein [Labilithrix sp.]
MVTLLASAPASAQRTAQDITSARQLYNEGLALREKGDQKGALEKFKGAHTLGNTPLTGIELCKMHQTLKQPVEASEACLSVGRIGPIPEESQRSKDARVEAAKIAETEQAKISNIKVKVSGVPSGFDPTVAIDGVAIPPVALSAPRPVNPGPHVITAKVGSGPETKTSLETKEGETKEIEVTVQPPPPDEKPPPRVAGDGAGPQPKPKEGGSQSAKIALGFAGVAATIGTVAGIVAFTKTDDLERECSNKKCGPETHKTLDTASTWGTVSTIAFIGAGVALGAGLVLYLTSPKSSGSTSRPTIGFTARGIGGTF